MKKIVAFCFCILLGNYAIAQTEKNAIRTSEDLKSGNYKDILTSFYQLAFEDLSGPDKNFTFKSTAFAWMLKGDSSLDIYENREKYRWARNLELTTSLNVDDNWKLKAFDAGVTYAFLNKREIKAFDHQTKNIRLLMSTDSLIGVLSRIAYPKLATKFSGDNTKLAEAYKSLALFNQNQNINDLDPSVLEVFEEAFRSLKESATANTLLQKDTSFIQFFNSPSVLYQAVVEELKKQALGTISLSGAFDGHSNKLSGIKSQFDLYLPLGAKNSNQPWELNVKGNYEGTDTLLNETSDFTRQTFKGNLGLNKILLTKKETKNQNAESLAELKLAAEYNTIISGLLPGEEKETFYASLTIRTRITESTWLPLELKYEPKTGNFLGLISIKFNLDNLKKDLK